MDKRKRDLVFSEPMTVRLTPDMSARLKKIADAAGIPPAILVRNWIAAEVKRQEDVLRTQ